MNYKNTLFAAILFGSCLAIPAARAAVNPSIFEMKVYKFAVSANEDCSNPITVYSNDNPSYADFGVGPTVGSGALADGTYRCVIFEVSDHIRFTPATAEGACLANTSYTVDVCQLHSNGGGGQPPPGGGGGGGQPPPGGGDGGGQPPPGGGDGGGQPPPSGGGGPNNGNGFGPDGGATGPASGSDGSVEQVKLLDGTTFECAAGDVDERVAIYMSTASSPIKHGNAFVPPTSATDSTHGLALRAPLVVSGTAVGTFTVDARGKVGSGDNNGVAECGMDPPVFGFE